MWLSDSNFKYVISATPLKSIDLIVKNYKDEVLLGKCLNRPAQGFWFVPGGRICKNETLDEAFRRLCNEELGCTFERSENRLLNTYEQFYKDSVFGNEDISTHYIVLGYMLQLNKNIVLPLPHGQHKEFGWWSVEAV